MIKTPSKIDYKNWTWISLITEHDIRFFWIPADFPAEFKILRIKSNEIGNKLFSLKC